MGYETTGGNSQKIDSLKDLEDQTGGEYLRWQAEITAAEKELDKWKRKARRIVKEFRAERLDIGSGVDINYERRFNLFAANVNILQTALMNQNPQPTVNREFKDPHDDVGRVACEILERALSAHNNTACYKMSTILRQCVQDMLVPGAGVSWHTYHADIESKTQEPTEEEKVVNPEAEALEYDEVVGENLQDEYVYWEDLLWSPCRVWEEVRWIARKNYMTRDQLVERFGDDVGKKVALDFQPKKNESIVESRNYVFQQAIIYEIWDKESEKITWFSKGYEDILDQKDDFLELDGFFPCPMPMFATISNGALLPIPDFDYARDQYRELNETNTRIALLVRACRVAGVYDRANTQLPALLSNAAENVLVPVDQWAQFAEKGGIKGVIDWIPLDQIVVTIDQLLKAREDVKQQIYEITGMSDIIRGASKASETLGAQKIKAQYASMRIQERQKAVVQYCSSAFDIQIQLMRKHMGIDKILELAQAQFMNESPELLQGALQLIKAPDFLLRCRVESDSLSDIDFQAEKQDRMEYMMTITNYLKETMGTIQNDPMLGPFLMQLLQFSLAGFKVGKKFEGELDRTFGQLQQKLMSPQPPKPTPEEQKVQGQMQLMQAKGQAEQQKAGIKMQIEQQKAQVQGQAAQVDTQVKQQLAQLQLQVEQMKAEMAMQMEQQKARMEQARFQQKLRQDEVQSQMDMRKASMQSDLQLRQAEIQGAIDEQAGQQKLAHADAAHKQQLKQAASQPKPTSTQ